MYWDVKLVKPFSDYRIYVEIEDGRKGIFDLSLTLTEAFSVSLKMSAISKWSLGRLLGPTSRTLPQKRFLQR